MVNCGQQFGIFHRRISLFLSPPCPERPYTYYDFTLSLCPQCLRRIEAKIVFEDGNVFMLKRCPEHGRQKVRIATDIEYYKSIRNYVKPSETPRRFGTATHFGCPYDCGLCTDHEQHSCLTVIEITDRCNLTCPTCYAESSPTHGRHRTLAEVEAMVDLVVANEGEPDVIQISGGEPTLHPQFWEILDMCKRKPIKHLMVNTNGVRLAKDEAFVARLATYAGAFEVYLQFDSFRENVLLAMRGRDLRAVRQQAIEHLNKYNLSTTLVVTLQKGLNDDEMGDIIAFALKQKCIRGVTFQPTQAAGRLDNFNPETDSFSLTEVRQGIIDQSPVFTAEDLLPVPCNPDALAMAYALKLDGESSPSRATSTRPNCSATAATPLCMSATRACASTCSSFSARPTPSIRWCPKSTSCCAACRRYRPLIWATRTCFASSSCSSWMPGISTCGR